MRTIRLYGDLGKRFGRVHRFEISSPAEAIRALIANFPALEKYLIDSEKKNIGYKVFNGDYQLDKDELQEPAAKVIKISPVVIGASAAAKIIVGTALIAAGVFLLPTGGWSTFFISTGASLVLGGVAQLLTKNPKFDASVEKDQKSSYLFNGAVNTSQQGLPVPLCYGRLIVGSSVISAGITVEQIQAGYRYVDVLTFVDIVAVNTDTNYLTAPPDNYIRKELLNHVISDEFYSYSETWYFRFYYNQKVLQEVPV